MKPYYTDPLAAAWMQKHFSMRFISKDSGKESLPIFNAGSPIKSIRENQVYVIHPDSLKLLDATIGDILFDREFMLFVYPKEQFNWIAFLHGRKFGDVRIIQRNNIPFMWPEYE